MFLTGARGFIHVLGEVSGRNLIPALDGVLAGDYGGEIKEAAKEALEKIEERGCLMPVEDPGFSGDK